MRIGEFSRACHMPISVLRYYDSCGLLKPVYIDSFTGYRHYSENSDQRVRSHKRIENRGLFPFRNKATGFRQRAAQGHRRNI
ncbi:MAG: MerR family DNA-binding transcriptional regulator [Hydrogeniiclostridium mannosilyticum]|nr:MerR family DNA-binding transcriptional regulator [Clostridiales bacterium]